MNRRKLELLNKQIGPRRLAIHLHNVELGATKALNPEFRVHHEPGKPARCIMSVSLTSVGGGSKELTEEDGLGDRIMVLSYRSYKEKYTIDHERAHLIYNQALAALFEKNDRIIMRCAVASNGILNIEPASNSNGRGVTPHPKFPLNGRVTLHHAVSLDAALTNILAYCSLYAPAMFFTGIIILTDTAPLQAISPKALTTPTPAIRVVGHWRGETSDALINMVYPLGASAKALIPRTVFEETLKKWDKSAVVIDGDSLGAKSITFLLRALRNFHYMAPKTKEKKVDKDDMDMDDEEESDEDKDDDEEEEDNKMKRMEDADASNTMMVFTPHLDWKMSRVPLHLVEQTDPMELIHHHHRDAGGDDDEDDEDDSDPRLEECEELILNLLSENYRAIIVLDQRFAGTLDANNTNINPQVSVMSVDTRLISDPEELDHMDIKILPVCKEIKKTFALKTSTTATRATPSLPSVIQRQQTKAATLTPTGFKKPMPSSSSTDKSTPPTPAKGGVIAKKTTTVPVIKNNREISTMFKKTTLKDATPPIRSSSPPPRQTASPTFTPVFTPVPTVARPQIQPSSSLPPLPPRKTVVWPAPKPNLFSKKQLDQDMSK